MTQVRLREGNWRQIRPPPFLKSEENRDTFRPAFKIISLSYSQILTVVRVPERGRVDAERLPMLCGPSGAWEGVEDREKHRFLGHSLVVLDATQSAGRRVFADG